MAKTKRSQLSGQMVKYQVREILNDWILQGGPHVSVIGATQLLV